MKQFVANVALAALVAADDLSRCLYCRRMSKAAGFLETYSYCEATDECLMDAWNYIDRPCGNSTWTSGKDLFIGSFEKSSDEYENGNLVAGTSECDAEDIGCPPFTSSQEKSGKYFNQTWALSAGTMCAVKVDASDYVARVIFDNVSFLGIEHDGAKIGDPITFESGKHTIWVYNGAESGSLTFEISFSGARQVAAGLFALGAASYLAF